MGIYEQFNSGLKLDLSHRIHDFPELHRIIMMSVVRIKISVSKRVIDWAFTENRIASRIYNTT